jgi:hypothetical protein
LCPINDIVSLTALPNTQSSSVHLAQADAESLSHHRRHDHTSNQQQNAQFFPEAIGSSMFIERNGRLNLSVVLRFVFFDLYFYIKLETNEIYVLSFILE